MKNQPKKPSGHPPKIAKRITRPVNQQSTTTSPPVSDQKPTPTPPAATPPIPDSRPENPPTPTTPPPAQNPDPTQPPTPLSKNDTENRKLYLLGITTAICLIFATSLLIYAYTQHQQVSTPLPEVPESQPPPPSPTLSPSNITFEVLNGSGKAGAASKAASILTSLGYQVIEVGNADNQAYQTSQLFLSEKTSAFSQEILDSLQPDFNVATIAGVLKDSTASARLIVGKE